MRANAQDVITSNNNPRTKSRICFNSVVDQNRRFGAEEILRSYSSYYRKCIINHSQNYDYQQTKGGKYLHCRYY